MCGEYKTARPGKISPKNLMPGQKSVQKPNDWEVFMNFRVPKLEFFIKLRSLFSLFYQILHIFVKNCQKPNAQVKLTSQNLLPGQKLTPKIPNCPGLYIRTSLYRESPPLVPPHAPWCSDVCIISPTLLRISPTCIMISPVVMNIL